MALKKLPNLDETYFSSSDNKLFCLDTPEKQLLGAILKRAMEDYLMINTRISIHHGHDFTRHHKRQAIAWFRDINSDHVGSCYWILEHISFSPEMAYKAIMHFIKQPDAADRLRRLAMNQRVCNKHRVKR